MFYRFDSDVVVINLLLISIKWGLVGLSNLYFLIVLSLCEDPIKVVRLVETFKGPIELPNCSDLSNGVLPISDCRNILPCLSMLWLFINNLYPDLVTPFIFYIYPRRRAIKPFFAKSFVLFGEVFWYCYSFSIIKSC